MANTRKQFVVTPPPPPPAPRGAGLLNVAAAASPVSTTTIRGPAAAAMFKNMQRQAGKIVTGKAAVAQLNAMKQQAKQSGQPAISAATTVRSAARRRA
jgi:hypothetical protein